MDTEQDGKHAVKLSYRPVRNDFLTGVRLRERRRYLHLVRWGFTGLISAGAVQGFTVPGSGVAAFVMAVCAAGIWATPHYQAHHALRTVSWQGEYRTSVGETGVEVETSHVTLVQRWSVFRGYRETRHHFVLLSRDPNILLVEVLPKRGLRSEQETERLRTLLSHRLPRL